MELNTLNNELKNYGASGEFSATDGEKVKLDAAGIKKFEETVPSGKGWIITVAIKIKEENL